MVAITLVVNQIILFCFELLKVKVIKWQPGYRREKSYNDFIIFPGLMTPENKSK